MNSGMIAGWCSLFAVSLRKGRKLRKLLIACVILGNLLILYNAISHDEQTSAASFAIPATPFRTGKGPVAVDSPKPWPNVYDWDQWYPKPGRSAGLTELLNSHSKVQQSICSGEAPIKAIVFYWLPACHALADSLRGLLLAYAMAVLTNRSFLVNTADFFPVEDYFDVACEQQLQHGEKGTIDWRRRNCLPVHEMLNGVEKAEVNLRKVSPIPKSVTPIQDLSLLADWNCEKVAQLVDSLNQNKATSPDVVLVNTNQAMDCVERLFNTYNTREELPKLEKFTHEPAFRVLIRRLFQMKAAAADFAQWYPKSIGLDTSASLCIHARGGGEFLEDRLLNFKGSNLSEVVSCVLAVERQLRKDQRLAADSPVSWMVLGDKHDIVKRIQSAFPRSVNPTKNRVFGDTNSARIGPIVHPSEILAPHLACTRRQRHEGVARILFDFIVLSKCRYALAAKSGFAAMSVMLGPDWSGKKTFAVGESLRPGNPDYAYTRNAHCRRFVPLSGQ